MKFPQELLDKIFSHLPNRDVETLRACSLVETSWVYPAQTLLFSSVVLNTSTYLSWEEKISPNNTELLGHVRSFHYWAPSPDPPRLPSPSHIDGPIRYLLSFRQLRTLTLSSMRIEPTFSQQVNIFSAFQHTLSSLSIWAISLPWSAFIALIDYFPNLRNLEICNLHYHKDDRQSTTLSRPLLGGLSIIHFTTEALAAFSDQLPRMQVAYDELTIFDNRFLPSATEYYQLIINSCGKSLLHLNIHPSECFPQQLYQWHGQNQTLNSPDGVPDLSNCSELRQLVIFTDSPAKPQCDVISSIISRNIRKIVFTGSPPDVMSYRPLNSTAMLPLERAMCGLVDKLRAFGYEHTLELEFGFHSRLFPRALASSRECFLKFKEKGRVILSDTGSGKTIGLVVRFFFFFFFFSFLLSWPVFLTGALVNLAGPSVAPELLIDAYLHEPLKSMWEEPKLFV